MLQTWTNHASAGALSSLLSAFAAPIASLIIDWLLFEIASGMTWYFRLLWEQAYICWSYRIVSPTVCCRQNVFPASSSSKIAFCFRMNDVKLYEFTSTLFEIRFCNNNHIQSCALIILKATNNKADCVKIVLWRIYRSVLLFVPLLFK